MNFKGIEIVNLLLYHFGKTNSLIWKQTPKLTWVCPPSTNLMWKLSFLLRVLSSLGKGRKDDNTKQSQQKQNKTKKLKKKYPLTNKM